MEEAVRARLLAMAGMSALVGTRIDWGARVQGAPLPAIALFAIGVSSPTKLAGTSRWHRGRIQIDCWGKTHKAARDVGAIIAPPTGQGGFHGLRAEFGGLRFRSFVIDRDNDTDTDSGGVVHRTRIDLNAWWQLL